MFGEQQPLFFTGTSVYIRVLAGVNGKRKYFATSLQEETKMIVLRLQISPRDRQAAMGFTKDWRAKCKPESPGNREQIRSQTRPLFVIGV
jgi:hypothetical protein